MASLRHFEHSTNRLPSGLVWDREVGDTASTISYEISQDRFSGSSDFFECGQLGKMRDDGVMLAGNLDEIVKGAFLTKGVNLDKRVDAKDAKGRMPQAKRQKQTK